MAMTKGSSSGSNNRSATGKWLAVVGIGEDGASGLSRTAGELVSRADVVFGGKRHLALASELIKGEARAWPSPFEKAMQEVVALRGSPVCVLASGDPFHHGVGATLARHVDASEMAVVPQVSAFSLAAARLGWALQDASTISLHGKPVELILPHLQPRRRIIALTSDANGPGQVAALLSSAGFGDSLITVLEVLGGEDERIRTVRADAYDLDGINPLNVVAVDVRAGSKSRIITKASGLADELFDNDGQITKREIRAVTLSSLAPRAGELLWDIGAGSGSVGIEWMLADRSCRAIAIEPDPKRAQRIRANANDLGVPGLTVIEGRAPDALAGLARPDAIFVGGGSDSGVLDAAIEALGPAGRLVVNAVTLETGEELIRRQRAFGGELINLTVARAAPVGAKTGWRPAMPVMQWVWTKS